MPDGQGATVPTAIDVAQRPAPVGARTILAFVGQNENGILRTASQDLMDVVRPHGLTGHVIDLNTDDAMDQLRGRLDEGVLFAWGFAGIGASLHANGRPLWDEFRIPFISLLADSPSQMPRNHHVPSRFVANAYVFADWLKMQRRLIRSPQISTVLAGFVPANPARDAVAWSRRPHRMLFVKTTQDPASYHARWASWPRRYRAVLEDAAAAGLQAGVGDITDVYLRALEHHELYLEGTPRLLFGLMSQVDHYIRDTRSTAMGRALLDLPVDIIGRGWEHLSGLGGKARFYQSVDATQLPGIYASSQFLLNTMPNISSGTHERVCSGLAAKCCVVSNENADMRASLAALPNYFGVDTESPELAERMAALFHTSENYDDRMQPGLDLVEREFSGERLICGMLDLANEVKACAGAEFDRFEM